MNYVTGVAYEDGATWIYRINDDQRFETPWSVMHERASARETDVLEVLIFL